MLHAIGQRSFVVICSNHVSYNDVAVLSKLLFHAGCVGESTLLASSLIL